MLANMAKRQGESQVGFIIGLSVAPTVISTLSVVLRFYTRQFILGGIASEDWAVLAAQFFGLGVMINNILMTQLGGLGRHLEYVPFDKGFFTARVCISK